MEPQIYNTGHGGSDNSEKQTSLPSSPPNELPVPAHGNIDSRELHQLHGPVKHAVHDDSVSDAPDHWVSEVEQLFDRTAQSPRQRADQFSELRRRYQQEILGIKQKDLEG